MKLIIKNNLNIFIVCSILIIFGIILRTKILLANVEPYNDAIALGCSILKPFSELFKPLDHGQVAPPFFMVLSKLMVNLFHAQNTLEYKDFILRIIPYISGILSLPLFSYFYK